MLDWLRRDNDDIPDETDYRQLLGDLHRSFGSSFELKPGMYTFLTMTFDRLDSTYGPIDDPYERIGEQRISETSEKIKIALTAGEDGVEQFLVGPYQDDDPFDCLEHDDTDAFLDGIDDHEQYYDAVTANLEELGYEQTDRMLRELAEETSETAAEATNYELDEEHSYFA